MRSAYPGVDGTDLLIRFFQESEILWEGDVIDCYGRCVEFMHQYGIEIWMVDRETPGLYCRLENPGTLASALDSRQLRDLPG